MKTPFIIIEQKMLKVIIVTCLLFLNFAIQAHAAVMQVETPFNSLHVGDVFTVQMSVDTQSQTLNAVDTTLEFPRDLLEFVSSDSGDSVVTVWMRNTNYRDDGTINFAGVTPGGFTGIRAPLLELTFKVLKEGQGIIGTKETQLLLHDGLGTPAEVETKNVHISVVPGDSHVNVRVVDDELPESFVPTVAEDVDVYNGEHFLVFATTDKGSGLDHYEVKEGLFGSYKVATSPYRLMHQALDRKVFIKAIDTEGNERVEILYPQNKEAWHQNKTILFSILVVCVLTLLAFFRFYRKQKPSA